MNGRGTSSKASNQPELGMKVLEQAREVLCGGRGEGRRREGESDNGRVRVKESRRRGPRSFFTCGLRGRGGARGSEWAAQHREPRATAGWATTIPGSAQASGRQGERADPRGTTPYQIKEERAWMGSSSVGRLRVWALEGSAG
jgi:hypothetical protein